MYKNNIKSKYLKYKYLKYKKKYLDLKNKNINQNINQNGGHLSNHNEDYIDLVEIDKDNIYNNQSINIHNKYGYDHNIVKSNNNISNFNNITNFNNRKIRYLDNDITFGSNKLDSFFLNNPGKTKSSKQNTDFYKKAFNKYNNVKPIYLDDIKSLFPNHNNHNNNYNNYAVSKKQLDLIYNISNKDEILALQILDYIFKNRNDLIYCSCNKKVNNLCNQNNIDNIEDYDECLKKSRYLCFDCLQQEIIKNKNNLIDKTKKWKNNVFKDTWIEIND